MEINLTDMMGGPLKDLLKDMKKELDDVMVVDESLTSVLSSLVSTDTVNISPEGSAMSSGADMSSSTDLSSSANMSSSASMNSSANMMGRNFAGGSERDDSYINARAAGNAATESVMASKGNAMSSSLINLGSDAMWYGSGKMRNAKTLKDNIESNKHVLKDIQKKVEEKVAEAQAPKDKNGKSIEQVATTSGNTGEAPAVTMTEAPAVTMTEAPAVTMTEAPAATVTEAPAVTVTEAPAVTVTEAPAVEVNVEGVGKAAQALPSIDVTI